MLIDWCLYSALLFSKHFIQLTSFTQSHSVIQSLSLPA